MMTSTVDSRIAASAETMLACTDMKTKQIKIKNKNAERGGGGMGKQRLSPDILSLQQNPSISYCSSFRVQVKSLVKSK